MAEGADYVAIELDEEGGGEVFLVEEFAFPAVGKTSPPQQHQQPIDYLIRVLHLMN